MQPGDNGSMMVTCGGFVEFHVKICVSLGNMEHHVVGDTQTELFAQQISKLVSGKNKDFAN